MNNSTLQLSFGTIKLYQKGRKSKLYNCIPDELKDCQHYKSVTDRKRIVRSWFKLYGSTMFNSYYLVSPGAMLYRSLARRIKIK